MYFSYSYQRSISRGSEEVSRQAHNLKIGGSSPSPATILPYGVTVAQEALLSWSVCRKRHNENRANSEKVLRGLRRAKFKIDKCVETIYAKPKSYNTAIT